MKKWIWLPCTFAAAALMLATACAPQRNVRKSDNIPPTESTEVSTGAVTAPNVEVEEASLRGGDYAEIPELKTIHFDYDSYNLKDEDRNTLKENAEYLKSHPGTKIEVSGNCDARGTIQYNLALGQRRAKAARDYYMKLGVSGKSIATISYGKEKPLCNESSEECWGKNRRAETLVRKSAPPANTEDSQTQAR